jgi:hypothetical protein
MPQLTKNFVMDELAFFTAKRKQFLADVREAPETAQNRIWQIEELREMGGMAHLESEYMDLIEELLFDLSAIKVQYEHDECITTPEKSGIQ